MYLVLVFVFLIRLARNASGDLGTAGSLWFDAPATDGGISLEPDSTLFEQPGLYNADGTGNLFTSTSNDEINSLDSNQSLDWTNLAVNDDLKSGSLFVDDSSNSITYDLSEPQFLANEPNCLFDSNPGLNKRNDMCRPLIDETKPTSEGPLPRTEPDPNGLPDPKDADFQEQIEEFQRSLDDGVSKGRIRQYPPMIPRYENDPEDPCERGQFAVCDSGMDYDRYPMPSGLYTLSVCELCMCLHSKGFYLGGEITDNQNIRAGWFMPWTPAPCYEPKWIWCCEEYYAPRRGPVSASSC